MNPLYTTLVCSVCCMNVMAQSINNITGRVQDATGAPLHKVDVYLFTTKDTVLIGKTQSDVNGNFSLKNETKLDAFLLAQCEGYLPVTQKVDKEGIGITLYKNITNSLGEAVVSVTKKSTLKHETDRFIFTPKGLDLEEPSVYEVLKHVPLLSTTSNSVNIMGLGTSTIYINGRKPIEIGDALMEKLRSYSPEQISKIEIITTPGAAHSAAIKGGIVNIVIKQNNVGWAGSSYTTVEYKNQFDVNENINLRYGKNKFNASVYLNGSFSKLKFEGVDDYNYIALNKHVVNQLYNKGRSAGLGGSFDLSYTFSPSHIIGVSGSLTSNYVNANYRTATETTHHEDSVRLSRTDKHYNYPFDQKPFYGVLAYYTWNTDTKGSQFSIDVDHSNNSSKKDLSTSFSDLNAESAIYTPYHIYSENKNSEARGTNAKATYKWVFSQGNNMNLGFETNASKVTNTYGRNDVLKDTTNTFSPVYNGSFKYKENVQALFVSYQHQWSKVVSTKVGIRGEYACRKGTQTATGDHFTHHELDWFPSANLEFNLVENKHSLSLGYSRNIRRPFLPDLDPFIQRKSETTYSVGNPHLKPDYINHFSTYYVLHNDYIFNLSLLYCKDGSTEYTYQDGKGNTVSSRINVDTYYLASLSFEVNKMLFDGIWRISANVSGSYTQKKLGKKNVDGTNFDYSDFSGDLTLSSTVRLSRRRHWNAEIFAYGATGYTMTTKTIKPYYFVYATLTKTFKFGGMLQIKAKNLLYSKSHNRWSYHTDFYAYKTYDITTQRSISVGFSIPFGKSNVRGANYKNSNKLQMRLQQ